MAHATYLRQKHEQRRLEAIELRGGFCADCGNTDPDVLEFDHVPGRGKKEHCLSAVMTGRKEIMLAELAKCDVVCANCHARRTKRRLEWRAAHPGIG